MAVRKMWRCRGRGGKVMMGCCGHALLVLMLLSMDCCCRAQVHNLSLAVDEGLPPGTLVGDIRAGLPEGSPGEGFFLSEESGDSPVLRDFQIDTDTGIVRTLRILDRERRERYSFVAATLLGEVVQVEIRVRDVNDHSPTFPVQSLHLQVSELTPPGTTFRLPAARDPDKGEYGLRGYSLLRGSQEASFIIRYGDGKSSVGVAGKDWGQAREQVRGAGNTNRARATLQVWKQIDESRQGSEQDKTAFDSAEYGTTSEGLGAHTGGTWVGISELTPVYGSKEESGGSHFEGEEGWDSELGAQQYGRQVKLAFLGYNQDAQSEGYVYESYPDTVGNDRSDSNEELQVEGSSTDSRLHHLDLELVQWLDREVVDKYHLEVEAFDGGHPSRTGRLFIDITVLDANDNPPTFDQAEYKGWVWENAPVGTSVCTVHAADPDLGSNGEVSYNLWSGEEYFSVEESTGIVRVSRPLDRENKALHQLVVQAKDGGSQPEISSVLVMVKVLDVNDNKPNIQVTLLTESGQLEVSEGARIGEYLARISVSDSDLEFEEEPWETSGDEGRRFESEGSPRDNGSLVGQTLVNKKTGKNTPQSERFTKFGEGSQKVNPENIGSPQLVSLTLEGADGSFSLRPVGPQVYFLCVEALLDREQKDLYELHLLASDSGSPPLQTLKTLLFRISDVNDQVPLFSQPNGYQVMVSESSPPGTAILNLNAKDLDEEGPNSSVVYTLLDNTSSVFMLDPYTGVLSITGILDFETETVINLVALATDQGEPPLSSTCQVTVMIEDSNDNEPVFMQQFYNVTLQEHSALGYCFLQVKATDSDSGSFGQVHYSLYDRAHSSKESQKFAIDRDSGHICVSQDIDREADPGTYDLLVKAEDEGGLSTQAFVHVEIEDINDNVPVFETTNYVASISSHTQAGTEILNVLAVDQDAGTFGEVLYEIIPGEKTSLFTMDSAAGIIYLVSALSHLEDSQVTFFVSAKDKGGRRSPVNASVTVKILKTAVAPAIFEKSRYTFFVAEDVPLGTTVGTVKAREPINSVEPISYRILSGDLHDMFSIISEFGVIITRTALDHETQAIVVLTIQSQLGNSSVFSSTQVNITITDVNDNPPVFPRKNERISVYQTIPPGSTLYIAQAEDIDSGYNGIITYSITSGKQDMFVIDPGTGILYLNTTLTMLCEHILLIMAEDNGRPALSSLLTLTIVVTKPKTDNTLTFGNLVHQIEINEDFPIYARVLQVKAYIEGAQSQKSKILYTLQPDDSVMFGIHYHTGWIFLRRSLDYERTTVYNLIVLASCSDFTKEQTATTSVVVKVLDVNDNSPVFSQPLYFYTVPESSSPLGVIDKIKASDSDSGKNGQLSFYLLSAENDFQINSQTGELVNCAALDHEQKTHHQLTVLVTDHGTPRRNTTTTVYITVTDLNDNKPYFPQLPSGKQLHVKVPEGQTGHMLVTTVFAKDPDAASNGTVLYYLSSDDDLGHFIINISTGEIWTTQALSTSIRPYYRLTVTARDQGVPPLEDYAVVNIQVISTAEGKSKGSIKVKILKIPEDAKPSQVVDSLISYGDWIIPNRKVQGHISEKEHNNHFLVDSATGDTYVSTPLDFETNPSYFLRFSIQDINKMPPQFHSVILKIDIEDTNDHHPMFPDPMVVIGIKENAPIGTVLYTFKAKDGDGSIPNSKVKYSLHADGTGKYPFFIHEWDGILTTNKQLDRETVESYVLTVAAVDQAIDGTPRRRCSLTARIIVQDINDNNPSFLSSAAASVMEDAEIGLLVHRVAAEDPDEGRNGKITFHITDGNSEGMFLLDEITGWLTLSSTLDREIRENYILSILATDNGTPILSATQILTVTVGDVNDNSPTFNQPLYEAAFFENQEPGLHVTKVKAEDMDSGTNAALTYYMIPGPGHELFRIIPHTGEVVTAAVFDRETRDHFIIKGKTYVVLWFLQQNKPY
ncbi:protocadherin-23 [Hyperolius riggenbachi]|uniref:protocadherin-23 n=1 Tax=Hyperolius riggenbachi TaxID=752182 RepID=UPI0035A33010